MITARLDSFMLGNNSFFYPYLSSSTSLVSVIEDNMGKSHEQRKHGLNYQVWQLYHLFTGQLVFLDCLYFGFSRI